MWKPDLTVFLSFMVTNVYELNMYKIRIYTAYSYSKAIHKLTDSH